MSVGLYVETSALLRVILEGDELLRPHLLGKGRYTSALTFTEARRAVVRAKRGERLDEAGAREAVRRIAQFERASEVLAASDAVLSRAGASFPVEPVRTLDAIHLATILVLDEAGIDVEVLSCDARVRDNVAALGFRIRS